MNAKTKRIIWGIIFSVLLSFGICFVVMGRLGMGGINNTSYPLFEIMYAANMPGIFIKRQEGIFISLWIISALISLFLYFTTTADFLTALNIKKGIGIIVLMFLIFLLALLYKTKTSAITTYCILQVVGGILTVLIIPIIYIFRRKKL